MALKTVEPADVEGSGGDLKVHVVLNKPEMILVEDSSKSETNALIFTVRHLSLIDHNVAASST